MESVELQWTGESVCQARGRSGYGKHTATLDYSSLKTRLQTQIPKMLTGQNATELPGNTRAAATDLTRLAEEDFARLQEVQNDLQLPWERERPLRQCDAVVGGDHDSDDDGSENEHQGDDFAEQRRQDQGDGDDRHGLTFHELVDRNMTEMGGSLSSTGHHKSLVLGLETTPRCTEKCYVCGGASGEGKCGLNTGTGQTVFDDECEECDDDDQRKFNKRMRTAAGGWRCATFDQLTVMEFERIGLPYNDFQSFTDNFLSSTITASTRSKFLERWQTC